MFYPTLPEAQKLKAHYQGDKRPLLPLYRDILADMETPVSAYCKTARGPYSFLLESVAGGERIARYSFIGIDPYLVMTVQDEAATLLYRDPTLSPDVPGTFRREQVPCHDPLDLVEAELGQYYLLYPEMTGYDELPRFHGGAVGYLAYETVARFEKLPVPQQNSLDLPLAIFSFTETVLVFDHLKHRVRAVTHLHLDAPDLEDEYRRGCAVLEEISQRLGQSAQLPPEPETWQSTEVVSNRTQAEFERMVKQGKAYIQAGDIFQVVLSQRLKRGINAHPFTIYRALRAINPSPYMFYLDLEDFQIIGASPELLVRVEDEEVTIHPIAGTRARGKDRVDDLALEEELKQDPKERAEHVMLVDLGRNDVGRVSQPGSVEVNQFMEVERYSHVMHLVSNVTGRLRTDKTPYEALRSGFPAGTVSGAPKIRAMEIISEMEQEQRGIYAGAVGYFSHSGNLDTAIALRTMVVKDGQAYIQAGGGVVADSEPALEYQESLNKAGALIRALDEADRLAQARKGAQTDALAH